jgi:hypothetical protein
VSTSAERDEYRLSADDEAAIRAWIRREHPRTAGSQASCAEQLRRGAPRAIGCTEADLRDSELQWIANEVGEAVFGMRP